MRIAMDVTKKKILSGTGKDPRFQDMLKIERPCSQTSLDPNDERNPSTEGKLGNDDELVKHMSNLPTFLQKVGNQNNIQENALNFGVLDWKRLEKWKYNERMPTKCHKKSSSSVGSGYVASVPPKMSPNLIKHPAPGRLNSSSLSPGKQPVSHCSRICSPPRNTSSSQISHLNLSKMERRDTSCEGENYFGGIKQSGRKPTISQQYQASRGSTITWRQNFHQKVESWDRNSEKNMNINNEMNKVVQTNRLALNHGGHRFSLSSNDIINVQVRKIENGFDDGVVPHNLVTPQSNDLDDCKSSRAESKFVSLRIADVKNSTTHESAIKPSFSFEVPKRSDADVAKQPSVKSRHPSPTRFNFGLKKLSKSFSFKESSSVPQLSCTYNAVRSGPMAEDSTDSINKEKTTSGNMGRSSPLRRLLDPLLKYKESQSSGVAPTTNGTSCSMTSRTMPAKGPTQDKKSLGLSSQGLLQLSLKNGLPFFKLMVDNSSSDVLAAVGKKLPSFGKGDHSIIYAFYSIHEIRKQTTTWMQKTKSKSCGLGFTILGQMKISSSYLPNLHDTATNQCAVRECVLYGVDREQVDKQAPEFFSDEELVAVVVQNSNQRHKDEVSTDGKKSYQERCSRRCVSGAMLDAGEDKYSDNAVVILPGGVHGVPSKGAHSSLISRWRSGGSCDCGGWDVGCKLQVLTNQCKRGGEILDASAVSHSTLDSVNLFFQGREKDKPVLNLETMGNGFHSLELDSTMPLLEAFATCVAFITCERFSEILDTNIPEHIPKVIADKKNSTTTTTTTKTTTVTNFRGKLPSKYATLLPLSPVGRI